MILISEEIHMLQKMGMKYVNRTLGCSCVNPETGGRGSTRTCDPERAMNIMNCQTLDPDPSESQTQEASPNFQYKYINEQKGCACTTPYDTIRCNRCKEKHTGIWSDFPVCPYCKDINQDWADGLPLPSKKDGDKWEARCGSCNRYYMVQLSVSARFKTESKTK